MSSWQSGIFTNVDALQSEALYTAKFLEAEEIEYDSVKKVRFIYNVVDANGEKHEVGRAFDISDKYRIRHWLKMHTEFNASDKEMTDLKASTHLVEIAYYQEYPFIQSVYPLDGDLNVDA